MLPIVGCFAAMLTAPALANMDIKPYVGFGLGYSGASFYDGPGEAVAALTGTNVKTEDLVNGDGLAIYLNAGVKFNQYFGVEAFYQHAFESEADMEFYGLGGTLEDKAESDFSYNSFGFDAVGYLPINNSPFSLIGSIGVGQYKFKVKEKETNYVLGVSGTTTDTESDTGFRFGVGGEYDFGNQWAARLMIRYVSLDSDEDKDLVDDIIDISLGMKYTF